MTQVDFIVEQDGFGLHRDFCISNCAWLDLLCSGTDLASSSCFKSFFAGQLFVKIW